MLRVYFDAGGPVMYAVFGAWVVVFAGVLDRLVYLAGRVWRRPGLRIEGLLSNGSNSEARTLLERERDLAGRGLARIGGVSELATSIGLFGTVLGIAGSFFARGSAKELAGPEALASGLGTALYTTVAGLVVFLFGQVFLLVYAEWLEFTERRLAAALPPAARTVESGPEERA